MTISNIENIIESLKNQIKGLDMQIEDRRKEIESARYQISHRRAGALGNDSDRMIIARAQERITQLNAQKKQVNALIASYKEALRKAKAEEAEQKAKEKEREKRRRDEEKEREKRAKEAEREQAKRIKATERENVNASKQQSLQGSLASLLQFYAGAALAETAAHQVKSSSKPSQPKPQADLNAIIHQVEAEKRQPLFVLLCFVAALICIPMIFNGINLIVLIITSAFVGCLYFLYKKFELTKCRDWNLIHVWKRYKQNKNN